MNQDAVLTYPKNISLWSLRLEILQEKLKSSTLVYTTDTMPCIVLVTFMYIYEKIIEWLYVSLVLVLNTVTRA